MSAYSQLIANAPFTTSWIPLKNLNPGGILGPLNINRYASG